MSDLDKPAADVFTAAQTRRSIRAYKPDRVDSETVREIVALASDLLGRDGFSVRSVPYREVFDYYRAADIFVLASLQEGFGRVYLEALMHGLPVIAHGHPVMEYVLGGLGYLGDLSRRGELTQIVARLLSKPNDQEQMLQRWMNVRDRFGWAALAPQYIAMFEAAAGNRQ